MAETVADIAIGVSMDISPLQSGVSKGSTALAAMEKSGKALALQLDKIGASGVKFQAQVNSFAGVATNVANSARSSADAFAAFDAAQATVDRLRASFDPVFAASKRYEAAVKELDAALDMGVISGNQHAQMLDRMGKAYLGAGVEVDSAGARFGRMGRMSGDAQMKIQQVGWQVQDFAVQVGAGTSATQAFAQQFPQLASAFGPVGVILGTLGAITIPLAAAAFRSFGDEAQDAGKAASELDAALSSFNTHAETSMASVDELRKKYGQWADEIKRVATEMLTVDTSQSLEALRQGAADATVSLSDLIRLREQANALAESLPGGGMFGGAADTDQIIVARDSYAMLRAEVDALAGSLGLSVDEAMRLYSSIGAFHGSADMSELRDNSADVLQILGEMYGDTTKIPPEIAKMWKEFEQFNLKASSGLATLQDMPGSFDAATTAISGLVAGAKDLYGYLFAAKTASDAIANSITIGATADGASGSILPPGVSPGTTAPAVINIPAPSVGGGGGAGGGGGSSNSKLDSLLESLETERETLENWYAESAAMLAVATDAQLAQIGGRHEAIERLEKEHQERLSGIRGGGEEDALGNAASFFGSLATITQAGGDKANKAYRAFAAAEALINTYRAASQTLADPKLGFFAKFAAVASIISSGMGLVNALKGGGSSSGGGSVRAPSSVSGAGAASGGPMSVANITLVGDTFSKSSVEDLFKQINDGLKTGRTINLVTV